jgi:glycosyltransferase involved in cell wall biosynthesis
MRVAIVHDCLAIRGGAEHVLEHLLTVFPDADVFSVVDFLPATQRAFLRQKTVRTTFIQRLPFARGHHRQYLPLMPLAIEQLDLSSYDLVISNSYAVAKGVITGPDQLHICLCCTPMRHVWDLQRHYIVPSGLVPRGADWIARWLFHRLRLWDARTAHQVDHFIAISHFIARRIRKVYRREATVIYPPVDVHAFPLQTRKEDFYLIVSRLVPYKRIDVIADAFTRMPDKRLVVIGEGPEAPRVRAKAGPNVRLLGYQPIECVQDYMQRARAFVFMAEEDFGIAPVEAQACGTPVIAYGKGGLTETVVAEETGLFFAEQTADSLLEAVRQFESGRYDFDPARIRRNAERFAAERFQAECFAFVHQAWTQFIQPQGVTSLGVTTRRNGTLTTHE